ncbi:helix-turn-helix domain-containing protein [Streptomyces sp. NPDC048370]|uniref:helix-turn-helix domain-containing protein n=1 Tax=Streptomyces sp. NPDC048370 TaxID=3365540 RepID=UPI003723BD51
MSTDFQSGREALGARLTELRAEAGLNGKEFAERLGWQRSKVSRLQNGRQTATAEDLQAWAEAAGHPDAAPELLARLRGLESQQRHWRRQLAAGHAPVQDRYVVEYRRTATMRGYETTVIPGLFQTPDYARHLLVQNAELMNSPRDTEAAVQARMRRQEVLYEAGKLFRVLVWEGALYALVGTREVMASQLDRLVGLIGMSTVELGIVPLGAPMALTPKHGFWIFDEERVIVETINTELQYDSADDVALYTRVWDQLHDAAAYGAQAHRLIARARGAVAAQSQPSPTS